MVRIEYYGNFLEVHLNGECLIHWESADPSPYQQALDIKKLVEELGESCWINDGVDESLICGVCMGSGEGAHPDTTCYSCKGSGTERKED